MFVRACVCVCLCVWRFVFTQCVCVVLSLARYMRFDFDRADVRCRVCLPRTSRSINSARIYCCGLFVCERFNVQLDGWWFDNNLGTQMWVMQILAGDILLNNIAILGHSHDVHRKRIIHMRPAQIPLRNTRKSARGAPKKSQHLNRTRARRSLT